MAAPEKPVTHCPECLQPAPPDVARCPHCDHPFATYQRPPSLPPRKGRRPK